MQGSRQHRFLADYGAAALLVALGFALIVVFQIPALRNSQLAALSGGSSSIPIATAVTESDAIRQISMAMMIYAADYDDSLPPDFANQVALESALKPYHSTSWSVGNATVKVNTRLAGEKLGQFNRPNEVPLLWIDGKSTGSDFIVGMADGSVTTMTKAQLNQSKTMRYDGSNR